MPRKSCCFVLCLGVVFFSIPAFSQSSKTEAQWTLGAMEFSFTQKYADRTSRQTGIASLVPKLILEQISQSSLRHTSSQEILDRTLDSLLTERLSLFLQLSKEMKTRDSILLTQSDGAKRRSALKTSEEKISELKEKIDENLALSQKAQDEFAERSVREARMLSGEAPALEETLDEKQRSAFMRMFFQQRESNALPENTTEKVTLYKNESSELFTLSEEIREKGMQSREWQKAVASAGIKGLLTGDITIYGDYASITAALTIFPGASVAGTITEVGSLNDISSMARNIAHYLVPKISNSMPVHLFFDIVPEKARENAQVSIDGVLHQSIAESIVVDSGIHTIEVSSPGYNPQSLTYSFENAPDFFVHVPLDETLNAVVNLSLKNPLMGTLYANGEFAGELSGSVPGTQVSVNGEPVIGQFILKDVEGGNPLSSFYYIDSSLQQDGNSLLVNVNPKDNAAVIDRRRVWMYRGYTALVLSVPLSLFGTGRYNIAYNSNVLSGGQGASDSEVSFWNAFRWGSLGVTVAAGSFFVFEIVRYLKAASEVLPKNARVVQNPPLVEMQQESVQAEETETISEE